jgi:predicted DNA-binding protein
MKRFPLRLDAELYQALRDVSAATGMTMADVVRDALKDYLARVVDPRAVEMGRRLTRLRLMAISPESMDAAIRKTARAEVEHPDWLEEAALQAMFDRAALHEARDASTDQRADNER